MHNVFKNHWITLALIFLGIVILKSLLIQYFPSPWIFSDEQSYFGMAQKIILGNHAGIKNSHTPGYSLMIAPALMLLPTVAQAHASAMLINIVITSGSVFLAYAVFRMVFNIEKMASAFYSILVSILPQFILFNYVVMSEALAFTLIYAIFVMTLLLENGKFKNNIWLWLALGLCVGFAPAIRAQYIVLFILFALYCTIRLLRKDDLSDRRGLTASVIVAVLIYLAYKFVLFPSVGSYEEMREGYANSLLNALNRPSKFLELIQILGGQLSIYFIATLFLPTFMAILLLVKGSEEHKYRDISILWILFVLINTLIATLHANAVMSNLGIKTIYSRYIDHLIPIIFTLGLAGMHRYKELVSSRDQKKMFLIAAIFLIAVSLLFFVEKNIFVNTFTIYFYQYTGKFLGMLIYVLVSVVLMFVLARGKRKTAALSIGLLLMASVIPALQRQHDFSRDTYNLYSPLGRWFDVNGIDGAFIRIDRNLMNLQESTHDAANVDSAEMDYVSFYSTLFWADLLTNKLDVGEINLNEQFYFISDRLLPRKILAISGPYFLYDKEVLSYFELDASMLSRFGKGLGQPDVDWVWINGGGRYFLDMNKAVVPTTNSLNIEVELRGFYPLNLDKHIEVIINGESIGTKTGRDNVYHFIINKDKPFKVAEIIINTKTWDVATQGYAKHGEGLGLDLKRVRVNFQ